MKNKKIIFLIVGLSFILNFFIYYYNKNQIDTIRDENKKLKNKIEEYDKIIDKL